MAQPHSDLDRGDTVPTQGQVPVPAVCTSADDLGRGTQLGNFLLTDPLGMGGMGEVWKAWQVVEKRFVVLKFLVPELRSDCQAMKCVREAFARTSMLHHQHIGPVLSLEEDGRYGPYLVMGHVEGQPLSAYRAGYVARHRAFPLEEVVRVLSPVAEALDYSHACGVVHRDIKPQNILVDANKDEVHLIDFGLAAAVEGRRADQQQRGPGGPGTCPYMPPEQWRGEEARPQSDQYALAVVTYELLSGSRPFQGATTAALRQAIFQRPVPPLDDQPEQVNRALARALAKRWEDRFQTCLEFVEAVAGASHEAATGGPASGRWPAAPAVEADTLRADGVRGQGVEEGTVREEAAPTELPGAIAPDGEGAAAMRRRGRPARRSKPAVTPRPPAARHATLKEQWAEERHKVDEGKYDTDYNILMLGTSGVGKTVFMTTLLYDAMHRESGLTVQADEEAFKKQIEQNYEAVLHGEGVPPTGRYQSWRFTVSYRGTELFPFKWIDYRGDSLDRRTLDSPEWMDFDHVADMLARHDTRVVFVLADAVRCERNCSAVKAELEFFRRGLERAMERDPHRQLHLSLLLTKSDAVALNDRLLGLYREWDRAAMLEYCHQAFDEVFRPLVQDNYRVQCFVLPISAFGTSGMKARDGRIVVRPGAARIDSYQIDVPLRMAFRYILHDLRTARIPRTEIELKQRLIVYQHKWPWWLRWLAPAEDLDRMGVCRRVLRTLEEKKARIAELDRETERMTPLWYRLR